MEMNREIKFRAWDNKDKGWLFYGEEIWSLLPEISAVVVDARPSREHLVLMQYTGLKDKKRTPEFPEGQEIYEGDVVRYEELSGFEAEESLEDKKATGMARTAEVRFIDGQFTPRDTGSYPDDGYYGWRTFNFEIIGNIYENPELINK